MRGSQAFKKYSQPSTNTKVALKNQNNKTHKRNISSENFINKSTSKIKLKDSEKEKEKEKGSKNKISNKNICKKLMNNKSEVSENSQDNKNHIFKIKLDNIENKGIKNNQLDSSLNSLSLDKKDINQTNVSIKQTFGNNFDSETIKMQDNEIQEAKNKTFYNNYENKNIIDRNSNFEFENYYERFFNTGNYNIFGQPIQNQDQDHKQIQSINNSDIYKENNEDRNIIEKPSLSIKITDNRLLACLEILDLEYIKDILSSFRIVNFNDLLLLQKEDFIDMKLQIAVKNRLNKFIDDYKNVSSELDLEEILQFFKSNKKLVINAINLEKYVAKSHIKESSSNFEFECKDAEKIMDSENELKLKSFQNNDKNISIKIDNYNNDSGLLKNKFDDNKDELKVLINKKINKTISEKEKEFYHHKEIDVDSEMLTNSNYCINNNNNINNNSSNNSNIVHNLNSKELINHNNVYKSKISIYNDDDKVSCEVDKFLSEYKQSKITSELKHKKIANLLTKGNVNISMNIINKSKHMNMNMNDNMNFHFQNSNPNIILNQENERKEVKNDTVLRDDLYSDEENRNLNEELNKRTFFKIKKSDYNHNNNQHYKDETNIEKIDTKKSITHNIHNIKDYNYDFISNTNINSDKFKNISNINDKSNKRQNSKSIGKGNYNYNYNNNHSISKNKYNDQIKHSHSNKLKIDAIKSNGNNTNISLMKNKQNNKDREMKETATLKSKSKKIFEEKAHEYYKILNEKEEIKKQIELKNKEIKRKQELMEKIIEHKEDSSIFEIDSNVDDLRISYFDMNKNHNFGDINDTSYNEECSIISNTSSVYVKKKAK